MVNRVAGTNGICELDSSSLPHWLQNHSLCLVEFYGAWCLYHLLTKRKNERLSEYFQGQIHVGSFDVSGSETLAQDLGIQFIPTIALFHNGVRALHWAGDTDLDVMVHGISKFLATKVLSHDNI